MYDSRALGRKEMCGKPWDEGRLINCKSKQNADLILFNFFFALGFVQKIHISSAPS